jgi:hypothetical protein
MALWTGWLFAGLALLIILRLRGLIPLKAAPACA